MSTNLNSLLNALIKTKHRNANCDITACLNIARYQTDLTDFGAPTILNLCIKHKNKLQNTETQNIQHSQIIINAIETKIIQKEITKYECQKDCKECKEELINEINN